MSVDIPPPSPPPGPTDNTFFTLRPGASAPFRSLQKMLEAMHDEGRALIKEASIAKPDLFKDPGPYKADPECEGVEVRLRALSRADVADYNAQFAVIDRDAEQLTGEVKRQRVILARAQLYPAIVAKMVSGIHLDVEDGTVKWASRAGEIMPEALVDLLDRAGFLFILFTVGDHFQRLGPLGRRGFGSLLPSTSTTSSAASAPSPSAAPSAAPATQHVLSLESGPASPPAPALDSGSDDRSGSPLMAAHSSSTETPTESSAPATAR